MENLEGQRISRKSENPVESREKEPTMNIQKFCEQIKKPLRIEFDPEKGKWRTRIDGIFIPKFFPNDPTIYFTDPTPKASLEYYVGAIRGKTIALEGYNNYGDAMARDFSKDIKVPDDLEGIDFS